MAKFTYDEYLEKKKENENRVDVHFINEYLKHDGDTVVVRFPYRSLNEIEIETGHVVQGVFPNNKYGKFVSCIGKEDKSKCPLCNDINPEVRKIINKACIKLLVYKKQGNYPATIIPCIWDRKATFVDVDLKALFQTYGDLTKYLFQITRSGLGTSTRYSIMYLPNKDIYSDEEYKADFTELNKIDVIKVLTKTMEQYLSALNGTEENKTTSIEVKQDIPSVANTEETTNKDDNKIESTYNFF